MDHDRPGGRGWRFSPGEILGAIGLITGPAALVGIIGAARRWGVEQTATLALFLTVVAAALYFHRWLNKWLPASLVVIALVAVLFYRAGAVEDGCVAMAKAVQKPYMIRSATYLVRLDRADADKVLQSRRMIYTVQAVERITAKDEAFVEGFDTHHQNTAGGTVEPTRWPGSDMETEREQPWRQFRVPLDLEPGVQRTLVTGADFLLPYPFRRQDYKDDNGVLLSLQEDDFVYTNGRGDDKGDAICELTILVESSTLKLDPGGTQAGRRKDETRHAVTARYEVAGSRWSLSARFPKMQSQEKAWLKLRLAN